MDEINLLDYLNVLICRKRIIVGVALVALLIAGIALVFIPRTYQGEVTLLFPQQTTDGLSTQLAQLAGLPFLGGIPSLSGRETYVSVLKSRTISENVLKRLDLDRYGLDCKDLRDCLKQEITKEGGLILTCQVPTSWLRGYVPRSGLKRHTAELAARMANAYIDELRIYDRSSSLSIGRKNRLFIERQLARTRVDLAKAEARLERFQKQHPTLVHPEEISSYADQALRLAEEQTEAAIAAQEASSQLARARATWKAGAPRGVSPEVVADSPAVSELRTQLAEMEVKRAALLENFTEDYPEVVSLAQQIEKTRDGISVEVSRIVAGRAGSMSQAHQELLKQLVVLEVERDGVQARRSALTDAMSNLEKRLSELPAEEVQYGRLIRDLKAAEAVYTTLLAEHAKARIAEGRETDNFVVLDDAVVPKKPSKPRVKLTLAAALVLGLMFGVLVATAQGPLAKKR